MAKKKRHRLKVFCKGIRVENIFEEVSLFFCFIASGGLEEQISHIMSEQKQQVVSTTKSSVPKKVERDTNKEAILSQYGEVAEGER